MLKDNKNTISSANIIWVSHSPHSHAGPPKGIWLWKTFMKQMSTKSKSNEFKTIYFNLFRWKSTANGCLLFLYNILNNVSCLKFQL